MSHGHRSPDPEHVLDVLAAVAMGDARVRIDVDEDALDEPMGLVANAVNLLLDDLEYRQREREEALRRVAGVEAKQEFLSYLSHDMQTPMAVLLGAVTVLRDSRSEEDIAATLPLMEHAIERLQRFVRQFLDLARLEAGRDLVLEPGPVDLREAVDRVVTLFVEDGHIEVEAADDVPPVRADAVRVGQILSNLVSNAFKYARVAPTIRLVRDGEQVVVEVADAGPGLAPDELERVFEKFERGDTAAGAGLGLYISRVLAEVQGGSLEASSTPGEGATFVLALPIADDR